MSGDLFRALHLLESNLLESSPALKLLEDTNRSWIAGLGRIAKLTSPINQLANSYILQLADSSFFKELKRIEDAVHARPVLPLLPPENSVPHREARKNITLKKPAAVLQARKRRLRQWLAEKKIPENEWRSLPGLSLQEIYNALCEYPEFRSKHAAGLPIDFMTFKVHFWKKQQIAKLPNNNQKSKALRG